MSIKPQTVIPLLSITNREWDIRVPRGAIDMPARPGDQPTIKSFTIKKRNDGAFSLELRSQPLPKNRALVVSQRHLYLNLSVEALRFEGPELKPSDTGEYIARIVKAGIRLNGLKYWFFGHSNSNLKSRSCILMHAPDVQTVDRLVSSMGNFGSIKTAAKYAKRVGLLFSTQDAGLTLAPAMTLDIGDVMSKDGKTEMSDGCGLVSYEFARQLAKRLDVHFLGNIYVPTVYQLRYLGYKGVVSVTKSLDEANKTRAPNTPKIHAHFRASMKKFTASEHTGTLFSVVGYSQPYAFGRLNAEIVTLLTALGISNEVFLQKQRDHFRMIATADSDLDSAILLISTNNVARTVQTLDIDTEDFSRLRLVEDLIVKGLQDPTIQRKIRRIQEAEIGAAVNKRGEEKVRAIIRESRLLYGICDDEGTLKEREVFVRIEVPREGLVTLINVDVIIVRNPCLHPGDILKLRAVNKPGNFGRDRKECLVFSGEGSRPAASMSSGGDLDGDKFFVCWDKDLIPTAIAESYTYPAPKPKREDKVTRDRLIDYWARYNTGSLGKVKNAYLKWLRVRPEAAMSPECQQLNALHSDAVDGAAVRIPDRLLSPPQDTTHPFILDVLSEDAKVFSQKWRADTALQSLSKSTPVSEDELLEILSSESLALPEYARVQMLLSYCRRTRISPSPFLPAICWDALTAVERHTIEEYLMPFYDPGPIIWNSLKQSNILRASDLVQHGLGGPIRLQCFYSSKAHGLETFFGRLKVAIETFKRIVMVLQLDSRFTVIIYKSASSNWDEDSPVGSGVRVLSITDSAELGRHATTAVATSFLYIGPGMFQLYSKHRGDTFVFLQKTGKNDQEAFVRASIALQKIDAQVQRYVGRVNREKVSAIEIHVISNRDRVGHEILDRAFNHVPTESYLQRIQNTPQEFRAPSLAHADWEHTSPLWSAILRDSQWTKLAAVDFKDVQDMIKFAIEHNAAQRVLPLFDQLISQRGNPAIDVAKDVMNNSMPLLSLLLSHRLWRLSMAEEGVYIRTSCGADLIGALIGCANFVGEATVWILQDRLRDVVADISFPDIIQMLWTVALTVRSLELASLILSVLAELKLSLSNVVTQSIASYTTRLALAVCTEYAGQVADITRPNAFGVPRSSAAKLLVSPMLRSQRVLEVEYRIDADLSIRQGDHIRLRDASSPSRSQAEVLDCIVLSSNRGSAVLQCLQVPVPHITNRSWAVHTCQPTATSRAEIDAVLALIVDTEEATALEHILVGSQPPEDAVLQVLAPSERVLQLNESQQNALNAVGDHRLTLIWGPPGTGKTSVVVQILRYLLATVEEEKILMTASTHNAVDNVLERFLALHVIDERYVVRAATDVNKVSPALHSLTVDAMEHDTPQGRERAKKSLQRIKAARVVFCTCAGAGLGMVRKLSFPIVLVDEASQIVESIALVPLVKGSQRAVLVGDHVQLRPNVTPGAANLQHDRSLFERLYTEASEVRSEVAKRMLEIQYRCSSELVAFPSTQFYNGRLVSGLSGNDRIIHPSAFPWPLKRHGQARPAGNPYPCVFIQCPTTESFGGQSKYNRGQVDVVKAVVKLLNSAPPAPPTTPSPSTPTTPPPSIALLTPYSKQRDALKSLSLPHTTASTIDGVQGREYDYIIFSTVRCNADGELGFLRDERRLNVAWTRARYGRIVIGDRRTLEGFGLGPRVGERDGDEGEDGAEARREREREVWREALRDCEEVKAEDIGVTFEEPST